ncbi:hypothetical protein POM88_031178 [Heracleum sosnowskyi]|uniref:Uncharacterized protein n=1 Tax=Heracleum sosnowskyi TaxID=360622 RepID=A0AAD8MGE2_9APIA|nr:hypothetical protein POM88_031178 [Heracleum sosnowskyi]
MKALEKHSKGAVERLREFDPKIWSKAYYGTHSKTESTENSISKCFNSWILRSRKIGHNKGKCPQKPVGLVDKPHKKKGRKRKAVTEDEIEQEMEKNQEEVETGEAELMEEALRNNEANILVFTQATQPSNNNVNAVGGEHVRSIFMPTPGLNKIVHFGGTSLASHPRMQLGTSKASKVKKGRPFTAPRRKK